ncbi:hypothetical protein [Salinibacterium sp. SWN248]|uniref:hypothetical protein n=1 Tax=Salinibacterium sp. SWN248 TaxID=2792056 RepID=UPI0018CF81EB|nr:hypothetical protein [Salinibacterium sp. SWN248]MBH0022928.1 hypothetical protein [Salinibacterium sp. SWN248]
MKRAIVWFAVVGGLGLITAVVLTVIEGVNYRLREEQGLDPIRAADWVAGATVAGFALFVISAVALIALAVSSGQKPLDEIPE